MIWLVTWPFEQATVLLAAKVAEPIRRYKPPANVSS